MTVGLFPPAPIEAPPAVVRGLLGAAPGAFPDMAAAKRFVQLIYFPASRRWRYQLNGKSGNTFVLNLLFELEFGTPFTCRLTETNNQHPDFALFLQPQARLLANVLSTGEDVSAVLEFSGLSLATVRDPFSRARSGFRYLCRSHEVGDRRFLPERLRLNALAGFDWERDPLTTRGFGKFLGYLAMIAGIEGADALDPHWLPQHLHIRPDLYKPDLIGRTEDLAAFAADLAARLDRPLPGLAGLKSNTTAHAGGAGAFYDDPAMARMVRDLYAEDFRIFDYDPDRVGG